ncbi:MAG: hypothetical protein QGG67_11715 [Gammaproteobacteria bacterium]|jgi:hypothetical protein|nr:hypothetical protein [Gammaproteobacteria bacterium]MDP6096629.1 hypothetical protein [Gammaproteobacteria bacterium]MDP7455031.1 hypothetical protein [Gammaproteobacteria bacterium]|tara:strand:- start:3297 stop:3902 length:606 start_codon:yes stop_codon:yes gene_type:complete
MTLIKRYKNLSKKAIAMFGIVVLSSTALFAQDADEENEPTTEDVIEPATQEAIIIEEIVVRAQRSFFLLRAQIDTAEDTFYSNYNDLNVNDEFDVDCRSVVYTGTHISKRECWPAFFDRLVARNSQDSLQGISFLETIGSLAAQYDNQFVNLRANIEKIAIENPSVADSLIELELLKQTLETRREACMKEPAILFLLRKCY